MDEEIENLQKELEKQKEKEIEDKELSIFTNRSNKEIQNPVTPPTKDENDVLVDKVFRDGIKYEITTNENIQNKILDSARTYVETKTNIIKTNVDTEEKESIFNNNKDACEAYLCNEKTHPKWSIHFMKWGYNVMLAIYIFLASFTVMPVVFLMKKIVVGVKKTWIAIVLALIIYLLIVVVIPLIVANKGNAT